MKGKNDYHIRVDGFRNREGEIAAPARAVKWEYSSSSTRREYGGGKGVSKEGKEKRAKPGEKNGSRGGDSSGSSPLEKKQPNLRCSAKVGNNGQLREGERAREGRK